MTARLPRCRTCAGPLFAADILMGAETCVECERKAIRLAVDPWQFFVRTIRAHVRSDNTVHVNDVRELLRGRIEPKQIGLMWRRAHTLKLLAAIPGPDGWEDSLDEIGGNDDKPSRIWRATPDLTRSAA